MLPLNESTLRASYATVGRLAVGLGQFVGRGAGVGVVEEPLDAPPRAGGQAVPKAPSL